LAEVERQTLRTCRELWATPDKLLLCHMLLEDHLCALDESLRALSARYAALLKELRELEEKRQAEVLRSMKLIGLTSTGAALNMGMLTNLKTVKQRLKRLNEIEAMEEDGSIAGYVKQEQASIRREKQRLVKNLGGIRNMDSTPDAMFVVDIKREHNAIAEARKLRIPIVALVDTNCDPELVDYPIAGNDDAIKAIQVIADAVGETVAEAKGVQAAATDEQPAEAEAAPTDEATEAPAEEAPAEEAPAEEAPAEPAAEEAAPAEA